MIKPESCINVPYTLGESVALYFFTCRQSTRYWEENERRFAREIVSALGTSTLVAAITAEQLEALVDAKRRTGYREAARVLHVALNRYFKWCREQGHIVRSPMSDLSTPGQPTKRDRILSDAELNRFWRATFKDKEFGAFYRLLALTLQERSQVAGMKWEDLHLDAGLWTINERSARRVIPLSPTAIAELRSAARQDDCPYVFGTSACDGGWSAPGGFSRAKKQLDAGMRPDSHWQLTDLRVTVSLFFTRSGIPPDVARRLLGHKPLDARFPVSLGDLTNALSLWTGKLVAIVPTSASTDRTGDSSSNIDR